MVERAGLGSGPFETGSPRYPRAALSRAWLTRRLPLFLGCDTPVDTSLGWRDTVRTPATLRSRPRSAPAQLPSSQVASRVAGGQAPCRLEPHGVVSRSATPLQSRPHRFGLGSRTAVSQSGLPALICVIRPPAVLARRRGPRTYAGERRATLTLPATQLRACWATRGEPEEARCGAIRVVFTPRPSERLCTTSPLPGALSMQAPHLWCSAPLHHPPHRVVRCVCFGKMSWRPRTWARPMVI